METFLFVIFTSKHILTKKLYFFRLPMQKQLLTVLTITLSITSFAFAQNYSTELQAAYDYARTVGITTQPSIDSANMNGSLIRAHMAKMMVNYAKQILQKTPDTSIKCQFSDIQDQSLELQSYIIQSCQMGLMGVGITKFNPSGEVTRAQFGTVMSRALYDDFYNDGDPYYIYHLQALQEAKIMTNISSPNAMEIRWYVMLMMMRAGGTIETIASQCESSDIQLLCLVGSSDCPSECQNTIATNAGTLQVSSTSRNVGDVPANSTYVGSLKFSSVTNDIALQSLTFQKIGTFKNGRIEENGIKIANIQSTLSESSTTISFFPNILIPANTSKIFDIFIDSKTTTDLGIKLLTTKNITSSAISVGGGFPIVVVE